MSYMGKVRPTIALTSSDIEDNAVTSSKIIADAVTAAKIDTNAVDSAEIAANAVGNSEMADDAVGVAELSATGTASATTYLRGDNAWSTIETGTSWQAAQTTGFTAVAGNGYPCNTTSGTYTVTLPASASVGDTIEFVDYAGTFAASNVILAPNGLKIDGSTDSRALSTNLDGIRLVYLDATQGWHQASRGNIGGAGYPAATGPDGAAGVTDGDYKYHIFTSSKTGSNGFAVSGAGNVLGSTAVEYLVIGGGAAGAQGAGGGAGGGGAGGYRNSCTIGSEKSGGDTAVEATTTVTVQNYDVTIGAGGSGASASPGANGTNSVWSTITSLGGGGGGSTSEGADGGSGGGGGEETANIASGDGTTGQGFNGWYGQNSGNGGGGGGGGPDLRALARAAAALALGRT